MALKKAKQLDNGIIVNYHRISFIKSFINEVILIEVLSYLDETNRKKEKENENQIENDINFINNTLKINMIYQTDYIENFTISDAYSYLKTLEDFKDAEDC